MMVSYHYFLALALLTATVRGAPADSMSDAVSKATNDEGLHAGVGGNIPDEVKKTAHLNRGLPVRVAEGNADGSLPAFPVKHYQDDVARLPVLENVHQPEAVEGQGSEH
ncbi:hypothetical protein L226DRAFT_613738 [Lentinus tigrinus ALCF2SS1-7]|uniref:Uncharacterized protein n=1 Tax=Lentinus tigrinus ALCF2SS1-6 TaxID=1328759 RepID=A0A5C2RYM0_9APHY|nr:hypothetical protein L227DRAFT_656457 [Lentinus tigrinus ALCF2SS1-6]RPD73954.1 hypothetical protein L226DRAFT_613738 [Lentinus tigrinus ALCF2SS1-7]